MQTRASRDDGEVDDRREIIRLWDELGEAIYNYFANRGVPKEEAEELRQETFVRALAGVDSFERKSELSTWLFAITNKVWLEWLRSRKALKRQGTEVPVDETTDPLLTDAPEALERTLAAEESRRVRAAIEKLPPDERRCLLLVTYQERSYADAAATLRLSENRVRSLLYRGKNRLKAWLAEEEGSPPP